MDIATLIANIQTQRNRIRTKLMELGLATSSAKLTDCADALETIDNRGSVSAQVTEGSSYTIPRGFHDGTGTVAGISGGGNYSLQSKSVTPTKQTQAVSSDEGYYGLSGVTVAPIPDQFQDVSVVTADAADVLANKVIVDSEGVTTPGTMPNIGTVNKTLSGSTTSYTIAKGYHSGQGAVNIVTETKTVTPTKEAQTINATTGKVITSVSVGAIPDNYIDTTDADATANDMAQGTTAYVNGIKIVGSQPVVPAASTTLTPASTSYTIPAGIHDGTGAVNIVTETKNITPTKSKQTISPTTGKVISSVVVEKIPDNFIDTTETNSPATAANIVAGKVAYVNNVKVVGTAANNGSVSATMDGMTVTSVTIPAGFTTGGTISLTDDIETALAEI